MIPYEGQERRTGSHLIDFGVAKKLMHLAVHTVCPACLKLTELDSLSECLTCGGQWCDDPDCPATCPCDTLPSVEFLMQRADFELRKYRLISGSETLKTLINSDLHVVALKDKAGRILFCSPGIKSLFGKTDKEMTGKIIFESMVTETAERHQTHSHNCTITRKPYAFISRFTNLLRQETIWYVVQVCISEDDGGRCSYVLALYRNVTELMAQKAG
jgi:PAS domain S-box-containing protein